MASHRDAPSYALAPSYSVPSTSFALVEYPGPVASTSTSQAQAVKTLGGQARLSKTLQSQDAVVELNFRPDVPFSHSVAGENIEAGNVVLLKVVKRRRKRTDKTKIVGEKVVQDRGLFKVEALGVVDRLVRFRSMADLQYMPKHIESDATVNLGKALLTMDVPTIQQYRFPEPSEDYDQELNLLPPPVFSRLTLPQIYAYRANPLSTPATITKPDGTEVTRLVNKTKYKGELPIAISFSDAASEIPTAPAKSLSAKSFKAAEESGMLDLLRKFFKQRPIWSRNALFNEVSKHERTTIQAMKAALPFVSYTYSDGPFRESCIRLGYDLKSDPEARFYQRIMIRNMANARAYLKKIPGASNAAAGGQVESESDLNSHIFDGENVHGNIGNYQLCDLTDALLKNLIQDEEFVREECDVRDGWWDGEYIDLIRQILKRKFFALLNEGIKLPDEAFNDLLEQLEAYRSQKRQHIDETVHEWDHMMETGGEGEYESMGQEGQHAPTALRKLISLKDKGKRSQKPKAKVIDDSLASPHHPVNAPAKSVADSRYIKRASALDQL